MVAVTVDVLTKPKPTVSARWVRLAVLVFAGLTFTVVLDRTMDQSQCGAFRIGVSAIGSCDGIGGPPTRIEFIKWQIRTAVEPFAKILATPLLPPV